VARRRARSHGAAREASRAAGDRVPRARLRDGHPVVQLEPDLALRPDPLVGPRDRADRSLCERDERQGPVPGTLVLEPCARARDPLGARLRGAHRAARPGARARHAGAAQRGRDGVGAGPVGSRAAGAPAGGARPRRGGPARAGLRNRGRGHARPRQPDPAARHAAVLARPRRLPGLRRVRAPPARARRAAAHLVGRNGRRAHRLRDDHGVRAAVRGGRSRDLRAAARPPGSSRVGLRRRGRTRPRAACPVRPGRLRLDHPRRLRRPSAPPVGLLRHPPAEPDRPRRAAGRLARPPHPRARPRCRPGRHRPATDAAVAPKPS
jgi:hypothetical protein